VSKATRVTAQVQSQGKG